MEELEDAGMRAALALGPGTRLAVIDSFVHRDGVLYLAAAPAAVGHDGAVDAAHLRRAKSASGAHVLAVHTSPRAVERLCGDDVPVPQQYETVLNATLTAECDGLMLRSGSAEIILTRTEIRAALSRRQRLAQRSADEGSASTR